MRVKIYLKVNLLKLNENTLIKIKKIQFGAKCSAFSGCHPRRMQKERINCPKTVENDCFTSTHVIDLTICGFWKSRNLQQQLFFLLAAMPFYVLQLWHEIVPQYRAILKKICRFDKFCVPQYNFSSWVFFLLIVLCSRLYSSFVNQFL